MISDNPVELGVKIGAGVGTFIALRSAILGARMAGSGMVRNARRLAKARSALRRARNGRK